MNTTDSTRFPILLFDADDTLLDFQAAQYNALTNLFHKFGHEINDSLRERYNSLNISLWKAYEQGEMTREEVLNTRFSRFFAALGLDIDGEVYELFYHSELNKGHDVIEGVFPLLEQLKQNHEMYIVTNGVADTQYERLTASGLLPYFKQIFVSEAVGYQKPMPEFFHYVFDHIDHFQKEKAIIIGDSLSSDMLGGIQAGIATCWFNRDGKNNTDNLPINYQIKDLNELIKIVN